MAAYDQETVGNLTQEIVKNIPNVTLKSYPVTHFDFYRPDIREQVVADQIAFLDEALRFGKDKSSETGQKSIH
ncbi:hypothetical protein I6N90_17205 [Paenibacillus sp. GSMTC-2017]|uniref:hypothetical protein n=1 Tax=Paenibacillus sp. GSMTC-2017 TaxID=2794350 RepID=UPI0018D8A3FB|nr:hypothetical protein [Paenibacillus sp. GSMTC-2017]MBH5319537.1 hypothetical protein [Paenibacillus sp. GSMTC-2017]